LQHRKILRVKALGIFRVAAAAGRLASSAKGQRFGGATPDTLACHYERRFPPLVPLKKDILTDVLF
jgi:hypothetical protein